MPTKKKYSQAARVQGILRALGTRHGITIGELCEEFGVNRRTIYRDLGVLQDAGYPMFCEVTKGTTYWKLEPSFKDIQPITFNQNELMALYFSRKLLKSIQGSSFRADIGSAFKKIETALPAKHIAKLERIEEMFSPLAKVGTANKDINRAVFETVQLALLNQNILAMEQSLIIDKKRQKI